MMLAHKVIVVGGGLAGLRAAIAAKDAGVDDVALLSQVYPVRSHSGAAQGGINAALGNADSDDSWQRHAFDTVKGSDYLADQDAAEFMCEDAPLRIIELEHWGCPFSRLDDGRMAQRPFGGAGFPRTVYSSDVTGHVLLQTLYEQTVKRGIKVYSEWHVLSLAAGDGVCHGLVAQNIQTGEICGFTSDVVLLATGGTGRIYANTTNALISTGSGLSMSYAAGAAVMDMEFIQFHPTTLFGTNILMTEGCRGEGGYLVNSQGERFMERYSPKAMELGPRDIVARSIQQEINEGRGFEDAYVHLDLRHLGEAKINDRLPGIRSLAINFVGVDPVKAPIPIQPGQHYTMGGVACDIDGKTALAGLYAAGECACVSVHGANRLGGNSLLETVVFGRRSGEHAAAYVQGKGTDARLQVVEQARRRALADVEGLLKGAGNENPATIRDEMKITMHEKVGVFRSPELMNQARQTIRELYDRFDHIRPVSGSMVYNLDLIRTYQLKGKLEIAMTIVEGALRRTESRGAHYRLDYTKRDDENWLHHTLAFRNDDGTPRFDKRPVRITNYQPMARTY
jgi:succinate dehydrogenase / fumarate reductase flavoprotein subunit